MNDGLKVKVTATADKIEKVEIVEHKETAGISDPANKIKVDGETGATYTSDGIKAAVKQALTEMGFDTAKFE